MTFIKILLRLMLCSAAVGFVVSKQAEIPSCLDENGNSVDWYIAYKFPMLSDQQEPFNSGYAYAYITSRSLKTKNHQSSVAADKPKSDDGTFFQYIKRILINYTGFLSSSNRYNPSKDNLEITYGRRKGEEPIYWTISNRLITDSESMILKTLSVAYGKAHSELNSIFYNDGTPPNLKGESASNIRRAHAKGALLIDDKSGNGVWLSHSTPQFPPPRQMPLEFNGNARSYGQTFMCINFDLDQSGKQIVNHLVNMYPLVYDSKINQDLYTRIPELKNLPLENQKHRRQRKHELAELSQVISTKGGQDLYLYSKSSDYGEDMYSGLLDSDLQTSLYVQSWRNGAGGPLNSSCPRNSYQVNNVEDLNVVKNGAKITWSYRQDHSKWAISDGNDSGVVCISDINRMHSQFKRGGGAICIKRPIVWSVFSKTISDLEPCPTTKHE